MDEPLSSDEAVLLDLYREATPEHRAFVQALANALAGNSGTEEVLAATPPRLKPLVVKVLTH